MEIFALLKMHFAMCGIRMSQKSLSLAGKSSAIFILVCVSSTLTTAALTEVNTFNEWTDILFRSVSIGICGIVYSIIVWKTSKLYEFIHTLADTVNASKN